METNVVLKTECTKHTVGIKKVDDYIVSYCIYCGKIIDKKNINNNHKETPLKKFTTGDIVRAINDEYPFTNKKDEWIGIVIEAGKYTFDAHTISCKNKKITNETFHLLDYDAFELVGNEINEQR